MKRYLLFIFCDYYPNGGMEDFKGNYDTIEELIQGINSQNNDNSIFNKGNNINVLDIKTMKHTNTYDFITDDKIDYDELNNLIQELESFEV